MFRHYYVSRGIMGLIFQGLVVPPLEPELSASMDLLSQPETFWSKMTTAGIKVSLFLCEFADFLFLFPFPFPFCDSRVHSIKPFPKAVFRL